MDEAAGQATGERQLDHVEQVVADELADRKRRRDWDRRRAFGLQMATVTLSAMITVLLGLRADGPVASWLADVALALGALVTVLAAWGAFFSHRTLWIQRSDTVHRLTVLQRTIAYHRARLGGVAPDPAEVDGLYAEFEEIVQLDHDAWIRVRQSDV
ncbi:MULTISPECIES: SLATT domain-containing protein [Kitasatospora]|uniref:DUF4231 domain-containing protein n=2 Tax=Kitasatospora TaxID=2063 RepID=A0ABT1J5K9_9ACTN|nr:SLATT domain-containing protein [Kitasatospora paracochleata]MCP2312727.1 hypothetical protein [Kitasatospora paracochleata]